MKKCNNCGDDKKLSEFNFKNKERGIYQSNCRLCDKIIRKKSYEKNKKTTYERNKRNRIKAEKWFYEYKSKLKCNRCPQNHPATLEFHHINPKNKKMSVANMVGDYTIERIIEEINKCEILCSNCHKIHHFNEKLFASNA